MPHLFSLSQGSGLAGPLRPFDKAFTEEDVP